jgi:predicted metal-dependent hydrolase
MGLEAPEGGTIDVIEGKRMAEDLLIPYGRHGRLQVLPGGKAIGNPTSVLGSPEFAKLIEELAEQAKRTIPARVAHYAAMLGVEYGRITIRTQKTRWGSCSSKGNLNFNCLLMLAPPEVLDSVVVHELCHRKHMNHSAAFYAEIARVMPDYKARHAWLKQNGNALMNRVAR